MYFLNKKRKNYIDEDALMNYLYFLKGFWKDDLKDGSGTYSFADGSKFEGFFQ